MAEHRLKVWVGYYDPIARGQKQFELRKNDRDYQVGDILMLCEYEPGLDRYTGRTTHQKVTYMLSGDDPLGFAFGLRSGFVALGIEPI